MKKLLTPILFLISSVSLFAQNMETDYLYDHIDREMDSIISVKLEQQKSNKSLLENVNLKDSTHRHILGSSGNCESFIKYYYEYDNFGRLVEYVKIDTDQGCESLDRKTVFTYDGLNVIERLVFKHIAGVEGWVNFIFYEYTYNENDQLLDEKISIWNDLTSVWDQSRHETYSYDNNFNLLEEVHHRWDEDIDDWEAYYKLLYVYDLNDNVIEYTRYFKDQSENQYEWSSIQVYTYTYDINDFLIEQLYKSSWNNTTEDWEYLARTNYVNDISGNPLEELILEWDFDLEDWVNYWVYVKSYNSNNDVLEEIRKLWEDDLWLDKTKKTYSYSSTFNLLVRLGQNWDSLNEEWVNNSRETNTYNAFDLIIEKIAESWFGAWYMDYTSIYEYDSNLNLVYTSSITSMGHGESSNHYYSEHDISLNTNDNVFQNSISIIPNPTNSLFYINGLANEAQLIIYDIGGKLVLDTNSESKIDVSTFQEGIYFVKIIAGDKITIKKLIKN